MTMIYEIIGKLLAAACFALLAYLTPKAKKWLEARTGKDHYDQLMQLDRDSWSRHSPGRRSSCICRCGHFCARCSAGGLSGLQG